jgi:hypothetical protein
LQRTGTTVLFQENGIVADNNRFQLSKSETVCMHLCNKCTTHPEPSLRHCNTEIPVVNETKFLGIIFNSKLTFKPHIANLRKKCPKAMSLLYVVTHMDWGADSMTLLRLNHSIVRLKLDYGCVVYGSARASYPESLDCMGSECHTLCMSWSFLNYASFQPACGSQRTSSTVEESEISKISTSTHCLVEIKSW